MTNIMTHVSSVTGDHQTIDVDEQAMTLHHVIHDANGNKVHDFTRKLTADEMHKYLSHIPHWQSLGNHASCTTAQAI